MNETNKKKKEGGVFALESGETPPEKLALG